MSHPPQSNSINVIGWRIFAVTLLFSLTVPRLWQRGMFLDGLTYAVLSRNLALGVGTFWVPSLSTTTYSQFFEHPPLGFGLQAIAFWLLGDHFAVERVFSLAVFALHALVIVAIWRRLLSASYDWLPLLFWALPAAVTWSAVNNMLENTQALFSSLAVLALLRTCGPTTRVATVAWSALAAWAVLASTLVKGPVGLFPLAVPLMFPILRRHQRPPHVVTVLSVMYAVFVSSAAALLLHEPARRSLHAFLSTQLVPRLTGARGGGSRPLGIAHHLVSGALARMGGLAGLLWACGDKSFRGRVGREAWFFLAVGSAASAPIVVSPVLAGHYFVPSMPFLALACAAFALPAVASFTTVAGSWAHRAPLRLALLLVAATVVVLIYHGPVELRDPAMVRSLDKIAEIAPKGATIGACTRSSSDWGLLTYMQRFYRISLAFNDQPRSGWFLATPGACSVPPPCRLAAAAETFSLFRCDVTNTNAPAIIGP
jgi:4-amino-4-deoxy-L-arabinose transferase-like glycosyltransferase